MIEKVTIIIKGDTIEITPSFHDQTEGGRCDKDTLSVVEIFGGGGVIGTAFRNSGYKNIFCVERERRYVENYEANHPETSVYETDVLDMDVRQLPRNPRICLMGIPCTHHSNVRPDLKKKRKKEEGVSEGKEAIRIIHSLVNAVAFMQPEVTIIEEVESFANSASEALLISMLEAYSYQVVEKKNLSGKDFGSLSHRTRYCLVMSRNPNFKFEVKVNPALQLETVEDILETPLCERNWLTEKNSTTIASFKRVEARHRAKGRGFKMQPVLPSATHVATISGSYGRRRVTDPVLMNEKGEYSFFSVREIARLHHIPDSFKLVCSPTTNFEIIGQGVLYNIFYELATQIKKSLRAA